MNNRMESLKNLLKKLLGIKGRSISRKEGVFRAIVFTIGYILSPLTWWNDVFVNIPIAYVLSSIISFIIGREYFKIIFPLAYFFTNILGLYLMHIGITGVKRGISIKNLLYHLVIALGYTILIYVLALYDIINPFL